MSKIFKAKHFFIIAIICIFSLNIVYAQNENSSKTIKKEVFCFGPKVSANFTNFNKLFNREFLPGADLGLFFRFNVARFYIQPEINYIIRNVNIEHTDFGTKIHIEKIATHYLNVPLFVGFRIVDFKLFKLRAFVGPEFNFGIDKNIKLGGEYQIGGHAGLGLDIWRFTIDAGYSFLADVPHGIFYNNVFKVGVGFKCY